MIDMSQLTPDTIVLIRKGIKMLYKGHHTEDSYILQFMDRMNRDPYSNAYYVGKNGKYLGSVLDGQWDVIKVLTPHTVHVQSEEELAIVSTIL